MLSSSASGSLVGKDPSARSACIISKNLDAVLANVAIQEAYVILTRALGFVGDPGAKGWSLGSMYSGKMYALIGETTETRASYFTVSLLKIKKIRKLDEKGYVQAESKCEVLLPLLGLIYRSRVSSRMVEYDQVLPRLWFFLRRLVIVHMRECEQMP